MNNKLSLINGQLRLTINGNDVPDILSECDAVDYIWGALPPTETFVLEEDGEVSTHSVGAAQQIARRMRESLTGRVKNLEDLKKVTLEELLDNRRGGFYGSMSILWGIDIETRIPIAPEQIVRIFGPRRAMILTSYCSQYWRKMYLARKGEALGGLFATVSSANCHLYGYPIDTSQTVTTLGGTLSDQNAARIASWATCVGSQTVIVTTSSSWSPRFAEVSKDGWLIYNVL